MGIVLLFICLFLASLIILIVSAICYKVFNKKYFEASILTSNHYETKRTKAYDSQFIGVIGSSLSGIIVFILCIVMMCIHLPSNQIIYNRTKIEYDMLQYRVEHIEDNNVGNELLYNDVVKFNQILYEAKRVANNKWINWFVVEEIAELDYIVLGEINV